jgi:hypothetical protein
LPAADETAGFHQRDVSKAIEAGITYRDAQDTCLDLLKWWPEAVTLRAKIAQEVNEEHRIKGLAIQNQPPVDDLRAGISKKRDRIARGVAFKEQLA